ncbi:hypothetical protein GJ496_007438 [Pomphorhynchus laevis]|nr:hypothetical protein GJ496_007438 [Pomphorhynchus laevis]
MLIAVITASVFIVVTYLILKYRYIEIKPSSKMDISANLLPEANQSAIISLTQCLKSSESSLDICVYLFTNEDIAKIVKNCLSRGILVRIITDQQQINSDNSQIQQLLLDGAIIRSPRSPPLMHHKFVIIDKTIVFTGSLNWTKSAIEQNYENLIRIQKREMVEKYINEFERIWESFATLQTTPYSDFCFTDCDYDTTDESFIKLPIRSMDHVIIGNFKLK